MQEFILSRWLACVKYEHAIFHCARMFDAFPLSYVFDCGCAVGRKGLLRSGAHRLFRITSGSGARFAPV